MKTAIVNIMKEIKENTKEWYITLSLFLLCGIRIISDVTVHSFQVDSNS